MATMVPSPSKKVPADQRQADGSDSESSSPVSPDRQSPRFPGNNGPGSASKNPEPASRKPEAMSRAALGAVDPNRLQAEPRKGQDYVKEEAKEDDSSTKECDATAGPPSTSCTPERQTRTPPKAKRHKASAEPEENPVLRGLKGWDMKTFEERQQMRRTAWPTSDKEDVTDPVSAAKYAPTIFANLTLAEMSFMVSEQFYKSLLGSSEVPAELKMRRVPELDQRVRTIMIDWLHKVWVKFKLKEEVMYHTVSMLDRYCDAKLQDGNPIQRGEYQLAGCACMWTASKYNEIYAPEMQDFVKIASNHFTEQQLRLTERDILQTLNFSLTVPSLYTFTQRLLRVAQPHLVGDRKTRSQHVAKYLIEFSLHDSQLLYYPPSLIAATAVYLGIVMTKSGVWFPDLVQVSGYDRNDLKGVLGILREYFINPVLPKLVKSVRERYKKPEHGKVSTLVTKRG